VRKKPRLFIWSVLDLSPVLTFCHDLNVMVSENLCTTIVIFTPKQNANTMTANNDFSLRAKLMIFTKIDRFRLHLLIVPDQIRSDQDCSENAAYIRPKNNDAVKTIR
jgi:hypothetical protein